MPFINSVRNTFSPIGKPLFTKDVGLSSLEPAISATEILTTNTTVSNGLYWYKPTGATTPYQAYTDFTTINGPWVHVGTAVGNTRGLWTYMSTWRSRTIDSGPVTTPYNTSTSSFNAGSFIYNKGNLIMIKHNQDGYVQASGFSNESWRDVYNFLNSASNWPSQPSYNRQLTVTLRGGVVTSATVTGAGLIYGTNFTVANSYGYWYVYAFDSGGDNRCFLATQSYTDGRALSDESDQGIGAVESGPADANGGFPGDGVALLVGNAFDAGTGAGLAGGNADYDGRAFSLWIKN